MTSCQIFKNNDDILIANIYAPSQYASMTKFIYRASVPT